MSPAASRIQLRRTVQLLCLIGFLWLFVQTEYRGHDDLPWPVSLLFRIDPLAALADMLAPGPFSWALWPALVLVVLTALLGRFFCGWICPLGTTLDGCGALFGRSQHPPLRSWRKVKYLLLLVLSVSALAGLQLLGVFDPLAIFLRTLTLALYPLYNLGMNALFDGVYQTDVPLLSAPLNDLYPFWRDHLMAFFQPRYNLALFTLLVFLAIVLLERIERRFWCRNLCPLGALLGLCSRRPLLQREPDGLCSDCRQCATDCRMGAVAENRTRPSECIECLDCTDYCPHERVNFGLTTSRGTASGVDLRRRDLLLGVSAGFLIGPLARLQPDSYQLNAYMIRPPGAVAESEFLRRCIRCGECMKVCIGQALHPAFLESGGVGLWTPLLISRLGYCEYNCTLCGQVCPTGALQRLPLSEKRKTVIGLAVIDKDRCLPYAEEEECLVCEEHCPTGEKAIIFQEQWITTAPGKRKNLKIPEVISKRCIGCGICETRCPVSGVSAIRVINARESRRPQSLAVTETHPYPGQ